MPFAGDFFGAGHNYTKENFPGLVKGHGNEDNPVSDHDSNGDEDDEEMDDEHGWEPPSTSPPPELQEPSVNMLVAAPPQTACRPNAELAFSQSGH